MSARRLAFPLLALALLSPLAAAEHEFSHRVDVFGRVVDSAGGPVPGAPLDISFEGFNATTKCIDKLEDRTNETGDLHACRHVHEIPPGGSVVVRVANATARVPIDPLLRRAYVFVQLDEEWPVHSIQGERAFFRNFTVTGRIVDERARPVVLEAVEVNATPVVGRAVNVSILADDGRLVANATARTDLYGDFRADLYMEELPERFLTHVEYGSGVQRVDAHAGRRVDVAVVQRLDPARGIPPPGSESGPIAFEGAALALAALASALLVRRGRLG